MGTPPSDETWTVGRAARYLNDGGVDFGITPKRVRLLAYDPECQIRDVSGGRGWLRLLASTVRAERARRLAEAGRTDPDWPTPPEGT